MHTQPCFYRFLSSFQQALLRAVHWPPKQTKRRKRYFGPVLRLPPMGLPNFLPAMSVSTLCFLPMIRRTFSGAYVTFEPGARSAWHTHPTGQHLIVTAGVGRTQAWGGPIEEIKAGDVIWCPPQVKHWHGASPTTAMTHIALTGTHQRQKR